MTNLAASFEKFIPSEQLPLHTEKRIPPFFPSLILFAFWYKSSTDLFNFGSCLSWQNSLYLDISEIIFDFSHFLIKSSMTPYDEKKTNIPPGVTLHNCIIVLPNLSIIWKLLRLFLLNKNSSFRFDFLSGNDEVNMPKWTCFLSITWIPSNLISKEHFNSDSIPSIGDKVPEVIIVACNFSFIIFLKPNPGLKQYICNIRFLFFIKFDMLFFLPLKFVFLFGASFTSSIKNLKLFV